MQEFFAGVAVGTIPSIVVLAWLIWRERSAFTSHRQTARSDGAAVNDGGKDLEYFQI